MLKGQGERKSKERRKWTMNRKPNEIFTKFKPSITRCEWIDNNALVILFYREPEQADVFASEICPELNVFCRTDTGYIRMNFLPRDAETKKIIRGAFTTPLGTTVK